MDDKMISSSAGAELRTVDKTISPKVRSLSFSDRPNDNNPVRSASHEQQQSRTSSISQDEKREGRSGEQVGEENIEYAKGFRLATILMGLALSVFIVFFDMTVISTAIPSITAEFDSRDDIGWYGSAYMLTLCSFQLIYGKVFELFPLKWSFLAAVVIQCIGVAVCGSAQSSPAFVVGRAVTGIGCSGILVGSWVILAHSAPLRQRAALTGFIGGFSGIGGIIGPLVSGFFTDSHLTWRWSFYVNLPICAVAFGLVILAFRQPSHQDNEREPEPEKSTYEKLREIDYLGLLIFIACVTSLLLALQWGGSEYPWNDRRVIALLVLFGVLLIMFTGVMIWKGDKAALPPRLMRDRNVAFACLYAAAIDAAYYTTDIWLPIWFQAVHGDSARASGIRSISLVGAQVCAALLSGYLVTFTGWYNPFMLAATILASVGIGLLSILKVDSGPSYWVTFPLLAGFGVGLGTQQPMMGIQASVGLSDIAVASAALTLFQNLGPAIIMSVANAVYANSLTTHLHNVDPGLDLGSISGTTGFTKYVPPRLKDDVLRAYDMALSETFYVPAAVAALSIIGVMGMKWEKLSG